MLKICNLSLTSLLRWFSADRSRWLPQAVNLWRAFYILITPSLRIIVDIADDGDRFLFLVERQEEKLWDKNCKWHKSKRNWPFRRHGLLEKIVKRESYRPFRDTFRHNRKRKFNRQRKIMVWGQKIMGDFTKGSCRAIDTAVVQLVLDFSKESPSILINWFSELFFMELRPKNARERDFF